MGQKKFWAKKKVGNLGRKFGLAKFYFGLLRFVCVMFLVTAKLNNNNTEFSGGWVVVVGKTPIMWSNQLILGYG